MKKNTGLTLLAVLILVFLFQTLSPAVTAANKITLRWFLRWDQRRLINVAAPLKEKYEKLHPNVEIVIENLGTRNEYWTKLQAMVAAGIAPDVIYPATHNAYALAVKGQLLNLTPFMKRDHFDLNSYNEATLNLYQLNQRVYGLPLDSASLAVYFNKDMFDASGVPYPKPNWTWDDFLVTAKKLTKDTNGDGKVDQYAVHQFFSYWPVLVWSYTGHNVFNDSRNPTRFLLNDAESQKALQFMADLRNKHKVCLSPYESRDIKDMFLAGTAAMSIIGMWRWVPYEDADFRWGVAALPRGKYAVNRSDGSCFAITKTTKYPQEAWRFVKYLAGPEAPGAQRMMNYQVMTPALKELANSPQFLKNDRGVNKGYFLTGRKEKLFSLFDPIHPVYDRLESIINQELDLVWEGREDVKKALNNITPKVQQELAGRDLSH